VFIVDPSSSYYPPRARDRWIPTSWIGPLDRAWVSLRRLALHIPVPLPASQTSAKDLLLALLLPGYGYARYGRRRVARLLVGIWCLAAVMFVVFLWNPWITGWALGAMASAHSSGQGYWILRERDLDPDTPSPTRWDRIWIPLACWVGCLVFLYWPGSEAFHRVVARPLPVGDRIFVFHAGAGAQHAGRGEFVAYRIDAVEGGPVQVREGLSTGTILALPGDMVEFGEGAVRVNGKSLPRWDTMPTSGRLTVEPGTRFIWPVLHEQSFNVSPVVVENTLVSIARVPESHLIGRPYARWFFWRQNLP
jgi:hypothetical protein